MTSLRETKPGRLLLTAVVLLLAVAVAGGLTGCSPKKNTAATRNYQAFITRYNVYFNGDEHYKQTLKDMESAYEDDYTGPLLLHPAEAYGVPSAPKPSGSFTRSIEKAQKAIQLHSIKKRPKRKSGKGNDPEYKKWLKREEYNPFLHNAWMLMARSQYHDGDFLGAASTFYYVSRHFTWLPNTVTEAQLWQARCYCAMDWLYEAEVILRRIKEDQLTTRQLKELYAFTSADMYVRRRDYAEAIPLLREAARLASKSQRSRLYYILGRVCALDGRKSEAYEAYAKAAGASGASHRARFNARIRQSEVYEGADPTPEVNALRRMARYSVNQEYLDQIYYAIGNLYLSRGDTLQAIRNYEEAAARSTRNGIDKAISQLTLGGLYYERGEYDKAQPCYSEAVPQLPETYPGYASIKRRSDVLDQMAVYAQNVVLNDSLLRLADMPEAERLKVIDGIIDRLKKKEAEEAEDAKREEYLAQQAAAGSNLNTSGANAPQEFTLNADRSWYFYNTATRNAGRTDFQRRWGSRKLEDDWRRRNKASFSLDSPDDEDDDEAEADGAAEGDVADGAENAGADGGSNDAEAAARAADPHFREYYLKQIPSNDVERATAHDVIQEGLYNSALILKDRLEDFDAARTEWDKLLTRYPDNIYRLDVYHNLYLMYMRMERPDLAEPWRQLIISDFPTSPYAEAMRDPDYIGRLRGMERDQQQMYEQAYDDYLNDRNEAVHRARERVEKEYPLSPLMPKFMFLDALAYVTDNKSEQFGTVLRDLLDRYPDADIAPLAAAWHQGLTSGRELHSTGSNTRGMLWDIRLSNDSTILMGENPQIEFTLAPDEPHYLVLLFPTDEIQPAQLLYEVARHNFSTYVVKDFDLEVMNFGPLGMLVIKGFDNQAQLNHYRTLMSRDGTLSMPARVRPVEISKSNFEKLLNGGGSFDDYFRFMGEETVRATHEAVLPPDEYPSAQEMYDGDEELSPEGDGPETSVDATDTAVDTPAPADTPTPSEVPVPAVAVEVDAPQPVAPVKADSITMKADSVTVKADTITVTPVAAPVTPAKPERTPATTPATAPAKTPAVKKDTKPVKDPPVKETPVTVQPVTLPDYPLGSEGDEDD